MTSTTQNPAIMRFKGVVKKALLTQLVVVFFFTLGWWLLRGQRDGLSCLVGGFINFLPSVGFSAYALSRWGASQIRVVMMRFYLAEAIKFSLTVVLFVLCAVLLPVNFVPLIVGYIVAQLMFVLVPMILTLNG